jgi:uncharacterized damage-inducible protein DinB
MNPVLAEFFRYNRWANLLLIDACAKLTDQQLDMRATPASRSVREVLVHLVGSELTFALRTKGRQHEGEGANLEPWPGFAVLREVAARGGDELIAIASALDRDEPVDLPYQGKRFRYPKSFFLLHALEHGAEHRTEIKTTLAQVGVETPDLDGWLYSEAAGFGREVP